MTDMQNYHPDPFKKDFWKILYGLIIIALWPIRKPIREWRRRNGWGE